MFTIETFKKALPNQMAKRVSQEMLDKINLTITDPDIRAQALDNILSYTSVLQEGRYKMDSYFDAVQFVTYLSMGDKNIQAWVKVFPKRYARLVANNNSEKDISAHVSMYFKTHLVQKIIAQTLIPACIMNAHHFQGAINTQVRLMNNAKSEKVQSDAANSLLTHLKPPETKKIELSVTNKDDSITKGLKELTVQLAAQHKQMLDNKVITAKDVAHQKLIIDGESADVAE